MATGFVTTQNLAESNTGSLDRGILDNLGGPAISNDILLFDGNTRFVSRLVFDQDADIFASDFLPGVLYRISDLGNTTPDQWHLIAGTQSDPAADYYHADYVVHETFTRSTTAIDNIGQGKAIGRLANDFTVGPAPDYEISVIAEGKVSFSNKTKLSMSGTLPLGTGEGFVDFDDAVVLSATDLTQSKLGVVNKWSGTSAPTTGITDPNEYLGSGTINYTSAGFVATDASLYYDNIATMNPNIELNGYTLQYEIEHGVFATDYSGADKLLGLVFSADRWQMNASLDYDATFPALTFGVANADSAAVKTAIEDCVDSTLTVDVDEADDSHSPGNTLITLSSTTAKYANVTKKNTLAAFSIVGVTFVKRAKWRISDEDGNAITQTIETANLAPVDLTHSLITISVQGSAGPEPYKISIYKDKSLILEAREGDSVNHPGASVVTNNPRLHIGGMVDVSGNDLLVGPTHGIRNVTYSNHATIPRRNLRIAVLGDSNISGGQYQADTSEMPNPMPNGLLRQGGMHSYKAGDPLFTATPPYGTGPHPDHNPPLHGIRQDSRYPQGYLPSTGNKVNVVRDGDGNEIARNAIPEYFFYREESLFARMEYYLANKGLYPTAFAPNQLGIYSAGLSGAFTFNINDQIDAMLGAALDGQGPGPIGPNLSLDVVVINLGTNDAAYGFTGDSAKSNLQLGIDRIITTFDPKVIVVNTNTTPVLANGNAVNPTLDAAASAISEKVLELDGYKNVVAVVNLAATLGQVGRETGFADAVHYNPIGYKIMAEEIVDKIEFSFATELPESSSFIYDVTDSNGIDKFSVKLNGTPVNVTGTLRRTDSITKANMEFLNVRRIPTSGNFEGDGSVVEEGDNFSTYTRFSFPQQRDYIEENLSSLTYKSGRVPFTKVDTLFNDTVSFEGSLRVIDTDQALTNTRAIPERSGLFLIDATRPTDAPTRAFSGTTSDWSKANVGTDADVTLSNAPVILIGTFLSTTNDAGETFNIYEITDLGLAGNTTQLHWHAAAGTTSGTDPDYAVGDRFKAEIAGTAGTGKAKQLGVEKDVSGADAAGLEAGSKYTISDLGTSQLDWNTAAGTTGVTYVVGSTFTATTAGAAISSGDGKAALIQASRNARVSTLTVAATSGDVVIETFENTQLVQDVEPTLGFPLASTNFSHKLPVIVNGDTYYILLTDET